MTQSERLAKWHNEGRFGDNKSLTAASKEYAERVREDGSRAPTTAFDDKTPPNFTKARQSDLRERYSTPVEENDRRFGPGRTHTHRALSDANSDFVRRAGADGRVPATPIDDTPQRARFAQAKPPGRKYLTLKERMMKWGAGRHGDNKTLTKTNLKYMARAGADGKIAATKFDDTPQRARFAQNTASSRAPKKKYRTQKEMMLKWAAGRHGDNKSLTAANVKYYARAGADGKIAATTFDDTPQRARFAQTKRRRKYRTQKERQNRARQLAKRDFEERMSSRASSMSSSSFASSSFASSSFASSSVASSSVASSASDRSGIKISPEKPAATFEQELTTVAEEVEEQTPSGEDAEATAAETTEEEAAVRADETEEEATLRALVAEVAVLDLALENKELSAAARHAAKKQRQIKNAERIRAERPAEIARREADRKDWHLSSPARKSSRAIVYPSNGRLSADAISVDSTPSPCREGSLSPGVKI